MMNRPWALRGVAASLLLLAAVAQTRADQVVWSYQWSSSPQLIYSSSSQSLLVMPYSGTNPDSSGTQNVTAGVLGVSSASASSPDTIPQTPYSLTMTLFDRTNGQQVPVTFSGHLGGSVWSGGAFLTNVLTSPTTQTVSAGQDTFRVTFESFGAPTANGSTTLTLFSFQVAPQGVPEPSTLVLGLLGVSFSLAAARRRRRCTPTLS